MGQDDFVVIPHTTYQKQFGIRATRAFGGEMRAVMIAAVPHEDIDRARVAVVEQITSLRGDDAAS